jgi:hypothetical protein
VLERIISGRTKRHQLDTILPWRWDGPRPARSPTPRRQYPRFGPRKPCGRPLTLTSQGVGATTIRGHSDLVAPGASPDA